MIFYKNLKKHRKTAEKNLTFSIFDEGVSEKDDSVSKSAGCKNFYNLSYIDGALKTGLGFDDLHVPTSTDDLDDTHIYDIESKIDEICGVWLDRWFNTLYGEYVYQLIFMDSKNNLWNAPLVDVYFGYIWTLTDLLKSKPTSEIAYRIDNDDASIFFSNEGMVFLGRTEKELYPSVPAFISSVVHYDNFFGITNTNRNTLIYTTNLNLKNWQEAESSTIEFLDNRGAFMKLVALNDYVYLFRENGITKISIYTSKSDFSFTHLFTSTSKIYENSVCVCGEEVFFVTRNALMAFDGNSVDTISASKLFSNFDNSNCASASLNGKYYLATRCNFDDGQKIGCETGKYVNNVLLEVDVDTHEINILRGVDIRKLLPIDIPYMCKLCATFYGENKQRIGEINTSGKTFSNATEKFWTSFATDLGFEGKRKKIKEILIETAFPCSVKIKSDEEEKSFEFDGKNTLQRLPVSVLGNTFEFSFSSKNAECYIKKPMIVFDVVS